MKITGATKSLIFFIGTALAFSLNSTAPASAAAPWGSIAFDGTQYLSSTNMSAPGTGDFTYELWFYSTYETSTNQMIMNTRSNITFPQQQDGFDLMVRQDRSVAASYRSYWLAESAAEAIKVNRWYHFALVRIGSNIYGYLDGKQVSGRALQGSDFSSTVMQIGSTLGGSNKFRGNIANIRYVKSALYTADFSKPTDDFTNVTNTSILMNTKNDGTFITNSISGTTFTNNGGATASSSNPFDWNAEQDRIAAQNSQNASAEERRKREAEHAAAVKAARDRLNLLLTTNQTVTLKDMNEAETPLKSVDSLLRAYKELISIKYTLTKPLTAEEAYALKFNKFMKYAMYERLTGLSSDPVFGRDLAAYGVISIDAPMKQLTTFQLLKQPLASRNSIELVDKFFAEARSKFTARKEHLTTTITKIRSR